MRIDEVKTINAFVAVFDILAFKILRGQKTTAGLFQLYVNGILPGIQHAAAGRGKVIQQNGRNLYVPDPGPTSVNAMVFSDTIVMWVPGETFDCFLRILRAAYDLTKFGFVGHGALLRGGIGHGDFVPNSSDILVGSAIENAHQFEMSQVWSGCGFSEECESYIKTHGFREKLESLKNDANQAPNTTKKGLPAMMIVDYDIPIQKLSKYGPVVYTRVPGLALDWTIQMYEGAAKKAFPPTTDPHARQIAENTTTFEEWARKNNR